MKMALSLVYAPVIFLILMYLNISIDDVLILKIFPSLYALLLTIVFLISYIKKESIIFYFAKKFYKEEFTEEEKEYIHKSTIFWIIFSLINTIIHFLIFFDNNSTLWVFYSSIGGYLFLAIAGLIQYIHRKYIFVKRKI